MRHVKRKILVLAAACIMATACQQGDGNVSEEIAANEAGESDLSLLAALAGSGDQRSLAGAVKAADLEETMSGSGPYTLFAPNNAAFAKLPESGAALMTAEAKGQLTRLLTGHVVPGVITAADLDRAIQRGKGKAELATLGGTTLTASKQGDAIIIADGGGAPARITQADTMRSNGVVHVIDTVLMPK